MAEQINILVQIRMVQIVPDWVSEAVEPFAEEIAQGCPVQVALERAAMACAPLFIAAALRELADEYTEHAKDMLGGEPRMSETIEGLVHERIAEELNAEADDLDPERKTVAQ